MPSFRRAEGVLATTPALQTISTTCGEDPDLPGSVGRSAAGGRRRRLRHVEGLVMSSSVFYRPTVHVLGNSPRRYQLWPSPWKCVAIKYHEEFYVVLIGHPPLNAPLNEFLNLQSVPLTLSVGKCWPWLIKITACITAHINVCHMF